MSKKIIFIIIGMTALGLAGYYYFSRAVPAGKSVPKTGIGLIDNLFPSSGSLPVNPASPSDNASNSASSSSPTGSISPREDFPVITHLTKEAISGATPVSTTTIRYIESSTGHIYDVDKKAQNYNRLSNTTLLKTKESYWSPNGGKVIIRYLKDENGRSMVKNYSALIPLSASSTDLSGFFLPESSSLAVSNDSENIISIVKNGSKYDFVISNFENVKRRLVLSLPVGQFNMQWVDKDTVLIITRPAGDILGYAYSLDTKTNTLTKLIQGFNGLTASMSSDKKYLYYSIVSSDGSVRGAFYDLKQQIAFNLDIKTFTDKCLWSKKSPDSMFCAVPKSFPKGTYPDDWYKGEVNTEDSLYSVDAVSGQVYLISADMGGQIDAQDLKLGPNDDYLIYTNKRDGTLWMARFR